MRLPSLRSLIVRALVARLRTSRDISRMAFRRYGPRTALIDRRGALTYRELESRVLRLQAVMQALGVGKGDIVFTWLPETGEQYETRLATYENGAIFAAFHRHLPAAMALQMIQRLRPALFIHDPALSAPLLPQLATTTPGVKLLAIGAEYEAALAYQAPSPSHVPIGEVDVVSLHMTSGTTGLPKVIGYTHHKYLESMRLIVRAIDFRRPQGGPDINMLGLPLTGPGTGMVLPTLLSGGTLVMPEDFGARSLAGLITRHRVTRAFMSPSAIIDLLDEPDLDRADLSSLTQLLYGSEMMPGAKLAEAVRRFGPILQQGYGSFEALPPITWLLPHEHVDADGEPAALDVLASAGHPIPAVEVVVRDEHFAPLPAGAKGYITVRSPTTFDGYWIDPERARETLHDDWVVMGDIGYFDARGYLHVLGREADAVRKGPLTIHPREVEEIAHRHPAVKEACLVQHGARSALVITLRHAWCGRGDRAALAAELAEFMRPLLPVQLQPDTVHIVDQIPRSFLNKMLRREVRAMLDTDNAVATHRLQESS